MTPETVFGIGSIGKSVTAVATLELHDEDKLEGASSTKCCQTAKGIRLAMTLTDLLNLVNRKTRFSKAQKTIADEKISLNVNRRLARPACIAGVLIALMGQSRRPTVALQP